MTMDDFRLHHSGEIREALIMIEGDNGGFELVKHGVVPTPDPSTELPYALVRSTDTGRLYFLVREPVSDTARWRQWHEISDAELARYSGRA